MITIRLNGEEKSIEEAMTLEQLIRALALSSLHFAVAVNRAIIPKKEHAGWILAQGDEIEIVHPVGGG